MKKALIVAACAALSACGGGGDGGTGDGGVTPPPSASPAGVWRGQTNTNRQITAIVLPSGEYWTFYSTDTAASTLGGVGQGSYTVNGNSLSSTDGRDFNVEGAGIQPANLSGTFTPGSSLNASVTYSGATITGNLAPLAMPAASLSAIAGSFVGVAYTTAGQESVTFSLTAGGAISGESVRGCTFSGSASARTDLAAYNVQVTFAGGACVLGTATVSGVAYVDPGTGRLYSAALNAGRSGGFMINSRRS